MSEETFLPDDLLRQLISVGEVDLLVGISSQTDANTLADAVRAIEQSFQQSFVRQRIVIVLIDRGGSKSGDGMPPAKESTGEETKPRSHGLTSLRTIHRVRASLPSPASPGMALRTILSVAELLRAKACAVVSPASAHLTAESIGSLLGPVYRDSYDFVAPLYTRHKYQGLLMRNALYPISRAVLGCGIREIFPAEWGFSGRLASYCLTQNIWQEDAIRAQPEVWMAITANVEDYRCCQVYVGERGLPAAIPDIVEVLRETVGTLFWCLEKLQAIWLEHDKTFSVPTIGTTQQLTSEPSEMDRHRIFEMFRSGVSDLEPLLNSILDHETHDEIRKMVELEERQFRYPSDLWVRTLYDFAASYHHAVITRDHLVQALAPLYRGMTYSYLIEHADSSSVEIEAANERLCAEFELQKPYLRERWKAKVEVKS